MNDENSVFKDHSAAKSADGGDGPQQFYFFKTTQFSLLFILLVMIVGGNLGVLYTLLFGRSRKSRMNYFITHLAIADLSVGIFNVPTDIITKITVAWYAGNIACKLIKFIQVWITYASTYVLVALSIDRYDAIRHPMKFSGSWKRAKFLVFSAWFFSGLFSTPILFLFKEKINENKTGTTQCWIEFDEPWKMKLYMTLVSISIFIIPAIIIANCYAIIILTIWSKNAKGFIRNTKSSVESDSRRASSRGLIPKAKIKTIKITLVIVSVFILCWSPYIVFDLLQVYGVIPENPTSYAVATLIQSLSSLNSAANPIIYCIFSTHFCKTLSSLPPFGWCFKHKAKRNVDSTTSNTQSSSLSEFLTNNKRRMIEHASNASNSTSTANAHTVLVH